MTAGALAGPPRQQTAAAQPEWDEKPMAAGLRVSPTAVNRRVPVLPDRVGARLAHLFPVGGHRALDIELEEPVGLSNLVLRGLSDQAPRLSVFDKSRDAADVELIVAPRLPIDFRPLARERVHGIPPIALKIEPLGRCGRNGYKHPALCDDWTDGVDSRSAVVSHSRKICNRYPVKDLEEELHHVRPRLGELAPATHNETSSLSSNRSRSLGMMRQLPGSW